MSYDEVVRLVEEIDGLVCAEGVSLMLWYLNEREEFYSMISKGYSISYKYGLQDAYEYKDKLKKQLIEADYEQSKEILNKHRELWLTLVQKSELSVRYFTPNLSDLFKRLTPLARQEAVILLNAYNFIPKKLLQEYEASPAIELAGNKMTSFVIQWKIDLYERYEVVNNLQSMHIKRFAHGNSELDWNINSKQMKQLVSLFRRYFLSTTETELVVRILRSEEKGNIIWLKSTESLVYFFTVLVEKEYLRTEDWGMVLNRRLMFCSKQGNIINHKNINASLYRIKQRGSYKRGSYTKEQKTIIRILERFKLIK